MNLNAKLFSKTQLSNALCILTLVIFTSIAMLTGTILASNNVSADDNTSVVDQINITVPVACTLSGTGMSSHNATINNGQYNSAIGETALKAFCNDNNGFAIYAIGYTDNADGKNVLTNSTLGATYDIVTGTATSGNTSNWAMKLSIVTSPAPTYPIIVAGSTDDTEKEQGDPDYTSFQEVPDDYERVAYRTAGTDIGTGAEGSTLKTTYQAYISSTQPAGTYTGQVKYTLVHPYSAAAPVACKPNGTTISTIACMQDVTSSNKSTILASMTEDQQYTLTDKRDGKTYTVSKLKDGNIWMTQNLDLDLDSSKTYTPEDTDLPTNTTWTPDNPTLTDASAWTYSYLHPYSYDPGDLYWSEMAWPEDQQSCEAAGGIWDSDWCGSLNLTSPTGNSHYHLGNYYNWTAAIAMNNSWSIQSNNQSVDQSICPAGWTLPQVGNGEKTFYTLWDEYGFASSSTSGSNNLWSSPLFFVPGGEFSYEGHTYVGYIGNYWAPVTSSAYSMQYARGGRFNTSGGAYPDGGGGQRDYGVSVRCVLR